MDHPRYPAQQIPMQRENYPLNVHSHPNFSVPPPPCFTRFPPPQNYPQMLPNQVPVRHNLGPPQYPPPRFESVPPGGQSKTGDVEWVEQFLSNKERRHSIPKREETMNICNAQELIGTAFRVVQELKEYEKELVDNVSNFGQSEWQEKLSAIESKKCILVASLNKFSVPAMESLKSFVNRRLKKRKGQKRRRAIQKEVRSNARMRRQQLHRSIDTWLDAMQLSVEKIKTDESLKLQADLVLADVTQKKTEARRQEALLSALLKLRQLRVQTASNRGERVSSEQVKIFNNVSEHLQTLWADQLKGYNLEEKGLRVMLEEETQDQKREVPAFEQNFIKWQRLLFGRNNAYLNNPYTVAEQDIAAFVAVRHDWDKFLAPEAAPMASAIPIGWVMPAEPSSNDWEKLLATERA